MLLKTRRRYQKSSFCTIGWNAATYRPTRAREFLPAGSCSFASRRWASGRLPWPGCWMIGSITTATSAFKKPPLTSETARTKLTMKKTRSKRQLKFFYMFKLISFLTFLHKLNVVLKKLSFLALKSF